MNIAYRSLFRFSWLLPLAVLIFSGCGGESSVQFKTNRLYLTKLTNDADPLKPEQIADIVNAVTALFGTPDEPYEKLASNGELALEEILDFDNVKVSAGAITRDNFGKGLGLYRQHCVHCHGVTGDGQGPTAQFLNPYPRDFRRGTFKFKSTPIGAKPTTEDLQRIVTHGIPGTAMPAFNAILKDGEIEAIVDYVKYLAIRGETERLLMDYQFNDADYDEPEAREESRAEFLGREFLLGTVAEVLDSWREAPELIKEVEERPAEYDRWSEEFDELALGESIKRGQALYYGSGTCYTCHGPSQLGDGQVNDYDLWAKELHDWAKSSPEDETYQERLAQHNELSSLKIRNIRPRNLRRGVYRGGRRPIDIFWRVRNGIDGTPMPAASSVIDDAGVWDIVNYVLSVPYEGISRPDNEIAYSRERQ